MHAAIGLSEIRNAPLFLDAYPVVAFFQSLIGSIPSRLSRSSPSFMALSASGECPCQFVTSPTTRRGSRERNDFVGLPRNFIFVRLGSSSIGPVGSTT